MTWLKDQEKKYNEAAKMWNALPGVKLKWPDDRFKVLYCSCKSPKEVVDFLPRTCVKCGYPYPGVYDQD